MEGLGAGPVDLAVEDFMEDMIVFEAPLTDDNERGMNMILDRLFGEADKEQAESYENADMIRDDRVHVLEQTGEDNIIGAVNVRRRGIGRMARAAMAFPFIGMRSGIQFGARQVQRFLHRGHYIINE